MNPGSTAAAQAPDPRRLHAENVRLRKTLRGLGMLQEIAAAATSGLPSDAVIDLIIEKSVEGLDAEYGALHLFDEHSSQQRVTTLARHGEPVSGSITAAASTVLGWAIKNRQSLRVANLATDPHFRGGIQGVRSVLAVPLVWKDDHVGLLSVFNKFDQAGFTEEDEQALHIIAAQSIHVLQAARRIGELTQSAERLEQENTQLRKKVNTSFSSPAIIGNSQPIADLMDMVEQISGVNVDVLITGESGTGKELLARTIHAHSPRAGAPFVGLNCAALPDTLLEAELFGVDKGVATGVDRRPGHFENAHTGTLFLDEIGDLSLTAQAKILRVLQERRVRRLGGREEIPVDVRIVAATHANLEERMKQGCFREDLFYRLNVIRLKTPAPREIPVDIDLLARHFLADACRQIGREPVALSDELVGILRGYAWPGNVRELRNEMKRLGV